MGREYVGTGGLRLHLDEPLSDQMADQVSRGQLQPVDDTPAPADEGVGPEDELARPAENAPVADWRDYAVSLGMPEDEAKAMKKADIIAWVGVAEGAGE
jgi:hypothetical protein